jgi:excinuclease UvrABC helicase subunit UvrB
VQFFDEEIEALAFFDPLTGEVLRKVPRLTVFPSTHYVTPRERLLAAVDEIKVELRAASRNCAPRTSSSRPRGSSSARCSTSR